MSTDLLFENARLQGRVITLDAEVKCLEAVIRAHERVDCLSVTSLKKQLVEADAENARLKAEVERLQNNCDYLDQKLDEEIDKSAMLCGQVMRLTKAGDNMARVCHGIYGGLPLWEDWNKAKEGKQP
jgi:regulator of replication initiation timing